MAGGVKKIDSRAQKRWKKHTQTHTFFMECMYANPFSESLLEGREREEDEKGRRRRKSEARERCALQSRQFGSPAVFSSICAAHQTLSALNNTPR